MCLHPQAVPPIPEKAACIARAAFLKGNLYMKMRDELGVFWQDQDFARLYPPRGKRLYHQGVLPRGGLCNTSKD